VSEVETALSANLREQLAAEFAERFDMLVDAEQVTPLARELTQSVLVELCEGLRLEISEDNAAQFVTHLAIAFTRLERREAEAPYSAAVLEEIQGRPHELTAVRDAMRRCEEALDRTIPEPEISYMAVHLCALVETDQ
jgi:transcriptional regulatory protein LevR